MPCMAYNMRYPQYIDDNNNNNNGCRRKGVGLARYSMSNAQREKGAQENLSREDDLVEAIPITVLHGIDLEPRVPQLHRSPVPGHGIAVYRDDSCQPRNTPQVRDNAPVQCCYPITVEDPDEVVHARKVALAQASLETASLVFCRSGWCVWAWMFAMPSSIIVASCCKHRVAYVVWGNINIFVCWFHAVAAAEALGRKDDYDWGVDYSRGFLLMVQVALCGVGVFAAHIGFKTSSALRSQVVLSQAGPEIQVPMQASAYPAVEEHYPQSSTHP